MCTVCLQLVCFVFTIWTLKIVMNPSTPVSLSFPHFVLHTMDWNGCWPLSHPALWLSFSYCPAALSALSSHRYGLKRQSSTQSPFVLSSLGRASNRKLPGDNSNDHCSSLSSLCIRDSVLPWPHPSWLCPLGILPGTCWHWKWWHWLTGEIV